MLSLGEQNCTGNTAHLDRPRSRMVALAASPPGPRSPRSPQTETATVMLVTIEDRCLAPRVDPSRDEGRHTMLVTCLPSKWQRTISRRNSLPPRGARSAVASIDIYQRYPEIGLLLPSQMRGRVAHHAFERRPDGTCHEMAASRRAVGQATVPAGCRRVRAASEQGHPARL